MIFVNFSLSSITEEQIKNTDLYIYGRGENVNFREAEIEALANLSEQISVMISSSFVDDVKESNGNLNEYSRSIVKTFSTAYLDNTEKKVIETDDGYIIYKYLLKTEKEKIFEIRKKKVYDYAKRGNSHLEEMNVGWAIRDFYWGLILLKSIPMYDSFKITDDEGSEVSLKLYLQKKIELILTGISFELVKKQELSNAQSLYFEAYFDDTVINDLSYTYFNGDDQIRGNILDGEGIVNIPKSYYAATDRFRITIDYKYLDLVETDGFDEEIKELIKIINGGKFSNLKYLRKETTPKDDKQQSISSKLVNFSDNTVSKRKLNSIVSEIITSIKNKNYHSVQHHFSDIGFNQFLKMMNYGEVGVLEKDFQINYYNLGHRVQIRAVPIIVTLNDRRKKTLIDKLSFTYEDGKVTWVNFALDDSYLDAAFKQAERAKDAKERLQCISFLEYYKTIFAMKDDVKIEQIFADSAAIFIGYVSDTEEVSENLKDAIDLQIGSKTVVKRVSKSDYITRLKDKVFKENDCVNIQFTDHEIIRRSSRRPIYAIQLHQLYYSTNYSDEGYLMLYIDFTQEGEPKIFFRYWQQEHIGEEALRGIVPGDIKF